MAVTVSLAGSGKPGSAGPGNGALRSSRIRSAALAIAPAPAWLDPEWPATARTCIRASAKSWQAACNVSILIPQSCSCRRLGSARNRQVAYLLQGFKPPGGRVRLPAVIDQPDRRGRPEHDPAAERLIS